MGQLWLTLFDVAFLKGGIFFFAIPIFREESTMNSSQIKSFLMAAECLNFTMAADRLYISQPVLSRNIAALEAELGVQLFVRTSNSVRLTPGGQVVYRWAKESQITQNDILLQARQANLEPNCVLRIGFILTEVIPEDIAEAILEFQQSFPDTQVSISYHSGQQLTQQLVDHTLDVGIILESPFTADLRLEHMELEQFNQCIAVSRAHPLSEFEPISIRAFANDTFISVKPEYSPVMTGRFTEVCGAAGFVPRIREVGSTLEQLAGVESQQGVALVPSNHVCRTSTMVRCLRLKEEYPMRLLGVWAKGNVNPSIQSFLNVIRSKREI